MSTDGVGAQGLMVNNTPMKTSQFWASIRVKTLPKNLIAPLSRAELSAGNGFGGTCFCQRCARSAGDGNAGEQQREEGRCIRVRRKMRRYLVI
jgi:hypothetical protein